VLLNRPAILYVRKTTSTSTNKRMRQSYEKVDQKSLRDFDNK